MVFLSRICPEKDPVTVIRVAIRTGVPFKITARIDSSDQAYFDSQVRPLLDHPVIEWVGPEERRRQR